MKVKMCVNSIRSIAIMIGNKSSPGLVQRGEVKALDGSEVCEEVTNRQQNEEAPSQVDVAGQQRQNGKIDHQSC